jgi:Ca2+-binding RTX toxin-like protein
MIHSARRNPRSAHINRRFVARGCSRIWHTEPLEERRLMAAAPVINEFLAANQVGFMQPNSKLDYADWIELHNAGDAQAVLTGFTLELSAPGSATISWNIPAGTTINVGQRLMLFGFDEEPVFATPLRTNFDIDIDGGTLTLRNAGGVAVHSVTLGPQFPNVSFGLPGNNPANSPAYFTPTSPASSNAASGFADRVQPVSIVGDAAFHGHGFYENSFQVDLTCPTPGVQIRYTLDGSTPTATTGAVYNPATPIQVNTGSTVLRAAAFRADLVPSQVTTETYLILNGTVDGDVMSSLVADSAAEYANSVREDLRSLPTLSIVTDDAHLNNPLTGIYANPWQSGRDWERPTSFELIYPDGRQGFQIDAGLRITGAQKRSFDQKSFRVLFKEDYGFEELDYPFFADTEIDNFDNLVLRAWPNDIPMFLKDQFVRDVQLAMGQPGVHGTFAHVYINGTYWGVYNPVEKPFPSFHEDYFGGDELDYDVFTQNDFVNGVNDQGIKSGNYDAWNAMSALANQLPANPGLYAQVLQYLDVDNFIDYLLTNLYSGNTDWDHNFYIARKSRVAGAPVPVGTEKFRFYTWDADYSMWTDRAFGSFYGVTYDAWSTVPNYPTLNGTDGQPRHMDNLLNKLITVPEFKRQFAERAQLHLHNEGVLSAANATERFTTLATEIDRGIQAQNARWHSEQQPTGNANLTQDSFRFGVSDLLQNYLPLRTAVLVGQLQGRDIYPNGTGDVPTPTFSQRGGLIFPGFQLTLSGPAGSTIYYTVDGSDPRLPNGAVSPSATAYAAPFAVTAGQRIRIRAHDATKAIPWSPIDEATFAGTAVQAYLRVTEVMYNPSPETPAEAAAGFTNSDDFEYIELRNTSSSSYLDIGGAAFNAGVTFTFPSPTLLAPGQTVLVGRSAAALTFRYGAGLNIAGEFAGGTGLANGGEQIRLVDSQLNIVQDFAFDDGEAVNAAGVPTWYDATDGDGYSLEVSRTLAPWETGERPSRWRRSAEYNGSPYSVTGHIVGQARMDSNANGLQDAGDGAAAGVSALLYKLSAGPDLLIGTADDVVGPNPYAVVVTDAAGVFRFTNVPYGYYSLDFSSPDNRVFVTTFNTGVDDRIDSDANPAGRAFPLAVRPGITDATRDVLLATATGVTATFDAVNGELVIKGTNSGETISVTVSGGQVKVNGANPAYPGAVNASSVKSIKVYGNGGNDAINLGGVLSGSFTNLPATGAVYIDGGAGADTITGSGVGDFIYGGADNDNIRGGAGVDQEYGGSGNDWLYGEAGNDYLYGEDGTDILYGGLDDDRLYGNAGNDTLYGDNGDGYLGYGGNDLLYSDYGNDLMFGEKGSDDYIIYWPNDGMLYRKTINEVADASTDTLGIESHNTGQTVTIDIGNVNVQTVIPGTLEIDLDTADSIENVWVNNDWYASDIYGNAKNNVIYDSYGSGTQDGRGGNDTFYLSHGTDTVIGGTGNDKYIFSASLFLGSKTIVEAASGGTDEINFADVTYGITGVGTSANKFNLGSTSAQTVSTMTITFANAQVENFVGSIYNDWVIGNDLNNLFKGVDGADWWDGGPGSDTLQGDTADDVWINIETIL